MLLRSNNPLVAKASLSDNEPRVSIGHRIVHWLQYRERSHKDGPAIVVMTTELVKKTEAVKQVERQAGGGVPQDACLLYSPSWLFCVGPDIFLTAFRFRAMTVSLIRVGGIDGDKRLIIQDR